MDSRDGVDKVRQAEAAKSFLSRHCALPVILLPNVWDAMSARIFAAAGFDYLATTSAGVAWALGYPDGEIAPWEEVVAATARIVRAAGVPVTADIEGGYGQSPEAVRNHVAEIIRAGVVGINLEDSHQGSIRSVEDATARLQAAREAARKENVPIVINARCDIFHQQHGEESGRFDATVARCQAYLAAGADCVYPFGLRDPDSIAAFVQDHHRAGQYHRPAWHAGRNGIRAHGSRADHDRFGARAGDNGRYRKACGRPAFDRKLRAVEQPFPSSRCTKAFSIERIAIMKARLDPRRIAPGAMQALLGLQTHVNACGLEHGLLELVKYRASQLNGCAWCMDMHTKDARAAGETEQRLYLLSAWHECSFYTERERAALAWTEVVTRLPDGGVSEAVFATARTQFSEQELVELTMAIIAINGWNRINVAFRTVPGTYRVPGHAIDK